MAPPVRYAIFASAIGDGALCWSVRGLVRVLLPEADAGRLRTMLSRRFGAAAEQAPPGDIAAVVGRLVALLRGEPVDLRDVALDEAGVAGFDRRVHAAAREIPFGRVVTYATLAARLGSAASPRAVGQALARNRFPLVVPCHRVVAAAGEGGFSAPGGVATKRRLLAIENARLDGGADLFDAGAAGAPQAAGAGRRAAQAG